MFRSLPGISGEATQSGAELTPPGGWAGEVGLCRASNLFAMDRGSLARMRWRRRGAWLWPAFIAAIVFDAAIGHTLPPAGETQTVVGAALLGGFLNVAVVILLSRPIGYLLRQRRPDLPQIVARDYGGTVAVAAVSMVLLIAGLVHHPTVVAEQQAMWDAIVRAQAYIGDRAPAEYRRNLTTVDTVVIQPRSMYRICVNSAVRPRTYCVIVRRWMPLGQSVRFDGHESNAIFDAGTG